jgi:hypothetical protein
MTMTIGDNEVASTTRRQPLWPGLIVLVACAASGYVLSVRGQTGTTGDTGTLYDHCRWLLLGLLVVAGIGLLVRGRIVVTQIAATLSVIAGVQLMTTGIVAAKHWRPLSGGNGVGAANLSQLILLAWVLIVAAGVATAACLVSARTSGVRGRSSRYRWIALAAGVVIAVGLPPILGSGDVVSIGVRSQAAYALLYSLPFGAAIAASGWLNRAAAITALATVAVCSAGARASHGVLGVHHPARGFLPIVVVAIALAALRLVRTGD